MPRPRRNHHTRTHHQRGRWHAVPRPAPAGAPLEVAAAIMTAAALATAAGARVLIAAVAPAPRLVLAAPAVEPASSRLDAGATGTALGRARQALDRVDADLAYAPDPSTRALLEMERLDLAARVRQLTARGAA